MDLTVMLDDPTGAKLPRRIGVIAAIAPTTLAVIQLVIDPTLLSAVCMTVAVLPWWLIAVGRCPRWPYVAALPLAAVTVDMSHWRTADLPLMLLVFLAGMGAMLQSTRVSALLLATCVAVPIGWDIGDGYNHPGAWVIGMLLAWACGSVLRAQQATLLRLRAAQDELAAQAVAEERRRIAREVHDLAAHSMAVTMLHLTGARLALADGEVDEADSALASAERLGRSSMDEIRHAVGVLADPDERSRRAPEPSAADLDDLVADYRNAGMRIDVTRRGTPIAHDPVVGVTLYRLVQESLANAARHAPGAPVTLALDWRPDEVHVEVVNVTTTATLGHGHGLIGMRERVQQLGGTLDAGPQRERWVILATLPCRSPLLEPR